MEHNEIYAQLLDLQNRLTNLHGDFVSKDMPVKDFIIKKLAQLRPIIQLHNDFEQLCRERYLSDDLRESFEENLGKVAEDFVKETIWDLVELIDPNLRQSFSQ
jgi:hypothetical protein